MKVGIQMYSVRNSLEKETTVALQTVAKLGYKYVETCPLPGIGDEFGLGMDVKEAKKFLDANGIKVVGAHVFSKADITKLDRIYEFHKEVGNDKVGLSAHFFANKDDLLRKCELYNKAGETAKKYGSIFYYHNHFHEFQKYDGKYVMDILLENTDPSLVAFELDTYWAARGGVDPAEMLERYKDRVILMHQKDFPGDAGEPLNLFEKRVNPDKEITHEIYNEVHTPNGFTEVGTGILDIQSYINAGNKVGVPYILLEQDFSKLDQLESIKVSMDSFKKFKGVEWN